MNEYCRKKNNSQRIEKAQRPRSWRSRSDSNSDHRNSRDEVDMNGNRRLQSEELNTASPTDVTPRPAVKGNLVD